MRGFSLQWFVLLVLALKTQALDTDKNAPPELFSDNINLKSVLNFLIPTTNSDSATCRNQSLYYLKELKQLKLWATEMFDATSKFSSGIMYGSNFDLGSFDECVALKVPYGEEEEILGKHCMAQFTIKPPKSAEKIDHHHSVVFEQNGNATVWHKILAFAEDRSKNDRNIIYTSFCMPSGCSNDDLKASLEELIEPYNLVNDFEITVDVNKRTCQVHEGFNLGTAEYIFLAIVGVVNFLCIIATIYDFTSRDDSGQYKFSGRSHEFIMCFSAARNLKKIAHKGQNKDGLDCLCGLKVLSMFFIIMGHRMMFVLGSPMSNSEYIEQFYSKWDATVLLNGPIIVDTFFIISGFLASYLLLCEFEKLKNVFTCLFLYIHRIIRILPAYGIVLAFYCTVFVKLGSGPFWNERIAVEQERCVNSWWANVLFINNYVNIDHICMFQSWYITCDMHFFIIAPVLVYLLRKKPVLGLATIFTLIVASIVVVFVVVYSNNEDAILLLYMKFLKDPVVNKTFKTVYIPTHMRASPYLVGVITAYLKYKMTLTNYKMSKFVVRSGWIISVFLMLVTAYSGFIFYSPEIPRDTLFSAFYGAMHHFTWSVSIGWMIIAISTSNGTWIEPLCTWQPLILLSRITYTAFLCHGGIQMYSVATTRGPINVSYFDFFAYTASDNLLAYITGLLLSLHFEAPIIGLEKLIFGRAEKKEKKPKEAINNGDVFRPKTDISFVS